MGEKDQATHALLREDHGRADRTFAEYDRIGERLLQALGKDRRIDDLRPEDFEERLREVTDTVPRWLFGAEVSRKASAA